MNFPLELVNAVLIYCQPNELFAVALANSNYRLEAERILYRSIVLCSWDSNADLKTAYCLSTLVNIQSKADMVKSFQFMYIWSTPFPRPQLDHLRNSLLAMRSLKHLVLSFPSPLDQEVMAPLLLPALEQCPFSLTTLYIPVVLLDSWLLSQNQLEVLRIRGDIWELGVKLHDRQLSICKQLAMQNSTPLIICLTAVFGWLMDRSITPPVFAVYAQWGAKDIKDSLVWPNSFHFDATQLVFDSLSEEDLVHDVLTSLAEHFPYLACIIFFISDPRLHPSPSLFSSLLQKFSYLESIHFEYYGFLDKLRPAPFQESYLGLAASWATNCPKLCEITFPDGREAYRDESGHWV